MIFMVQAKREHDVTETGVIYVATGASYVDLAVQSALSLRATNPGLPCDLFTDLTDAPGLGVFDQVHPVPRVHNRAKLDGLPLSRFPRTLFLDADTLVVGPFGDLFDLLQPFDLCMAHDVRRASKGAREGVAVKTPNVFTQLNSGVILYRLTPETQAFFADWAKRYGDSGAKRDQTVLKDLLWDSDLKVHILPPEWNMRRVTELDAREPLDGGAKIIHSHRLLQHILTPGAERVTDLHRLIELERQALAEEWALIPETDPIRRFDAVIEGVNAPKSDRGQ
jgi:hypothetical protein